MRDLAGRVAVVTGGGSGIGRGIALALAAAGAKVAVADIVEANARAVAGEIAAAGGSAIGILCDVTDRASIAAMKQEANRRLGPVSLLVSNAGAIMVERMLDMTGDDVDWVIAANLTATIGCLQAFLPDMIAAGEGHVVATSSASAIVPLHLGRNPPYVAAKSGLFGMMLHLRPVLAEQGIGVSVLVPGAVTSNFNQSPRYRPERFGGPREAAMPQGRADAANPALRPSSEQFRPPEEVAAMVLQAIREDRAVIVTDATQREKFKSTLVALVDEAFDDLDRFDAATA